MTPLEKDAVHLAESYAALAEHDSQAWDWAIGMAKRAIEIAVGADDERAIYLVDVTERFHRRFCRGTEDNQ